jgi:hypothetical protein
MEDGQDRQEPADENADLENVVASLDTPESESEPIAHSDDAFVSVSEDASTPRTDGPTSELVIPVVELQLDDESEPVDPEIAALQADLESEAEATEAPTAEMEAVPEPEEALAVIVAAPVGGTQEAVEDSKDLALPVDRPGVPIWPFLVYFALWVIFAGLLVWQSLQAPAGTPVYELNIYGMSILAGLILTAIGPILAIGVWFVSWLSRPGARSGLFSRCLIIGAVTTLGGVALWMIALGAVDMLRLGRLL